METIYKNDELLQLTKGTYYIHDSCVSRFDIYLQEYRLYIDVYFNSGESRFKACKQLKIHFLGVTEYEFFWNHQYNFYIVERYKFIKTEKGYYLSLDPYDESGEMSDGDHDIILCDEVEGHFI